MTSSPFATAGRAPRLVSTQVVALYHPETGLIHHAHTVFVHEGGRAVPEREAIEVAHRQARNLGHETAKLKVKLSDNADHGRHPHRVDIKTGKFVALEISKAR